MERIKNLMAEIKGYTDDSDDLISEGDSLLKDAQRNLDVSTYTW